MEFYTNLQNCFFAINPVHELSSQMWAHYVTYAAHNISQQIFFFFSFRRIFHIFGNTVGVPFGIVCFSADIVHKICYISNQSQNKNVHKK